MKEEKCIYLDYAANTPVDENVLEAFNKATLKYIANPNSTHKLGTMAKERIDLSTKNILELLQEKANLEDNFEIIYTSGASESNNLALKGIASAYRQNGKHIITTFLEHSSVSSPLTRLKEKGYEIDLVQINNDGKINIDNLKELLRNDTILVSICYVDSETGIIQDIEKISDLLKDYPNCLLHVDCTQAIGKINVNLKNIDLITFSPHKFYGINGFGALLKRKNVILEPLIHGGASTTIYRSGTPVVGQVVALEEALRQALYNLESRYEYVCNINKYLIENLKKYDLVQINTPSFDNPFIINLGIKGVKAVNFKDELEKYNVCVSIKSACSSTLTPSRIIMAITKDRKRALSSWRISLSHLCTKEQIDDFLNIFDICYKNVLDDKK